MVLKLQNSKKFLGSVFDLPGDDIDPNKNQSPEWLEGFCSFVGLKCFGDAFAVAFRSLEEKTCWIHSITHSKNLITCGTYAFDSRWLLMTCQWLVYITSSLPQLFCQIFPSTCTTAGAAVTCTTGRTGGAYAERPVETTGPRLRVQLLCPMIKIGRTLANYANCPVYKNGEKLYDFRLSWITASKKCRVDWLHATHCRVLGSFVCFGHRTLQQASARDCQRLQNPQISRTISIPS